MKKAEEINIMVLYEVRKVEHKYQSSIAIHLSEIEVESSECNTLFRATPGIAILNNIRRVSLKLYIIINNNKLYIQILDVFTSLCA